jgi:hypothetical protein
MFRMQPCTGLRALLLAALLMAAAILVPRPSAAETRDFPTQAALLRFMAHYRPLADQRDLPAAVSAMGQFGVFHNPDAAGVYVGFLAGALAGAPRDADHLVAAYARLAVEDQWAAVRAIAWSGLPDWKGLMRRHAAKFPTRRVMIDKYLAGETPILQQLALGEAKPGFWSRVRGYLRPDDRAILRARLKQRLAPTPDLLDALWGYYFASRHYQPIGRLVAMLPWASERDDSERLMLGAMAKLTLATNAARDPALNALLKRARPHVAPAAGQELDGVIDAADTVNTGAIRTTALAAIDDIKRKGSASSREMAWWSRVGESAIALGCIGAAAAGQVQLGLPCVIGGAVTSAVAKNIGAGG